MTINKEVFYISKYKKGAGGKLVKEKQLKDIKLSILQKIFNIDPNDPDILTRKMVDSYNISNKEKELLYEWLDFEVDLNKYDYQVSLSKDHNHKEIYIIYEYEKSFHPLFIEECRINIGINFIRKLFKDEKYSMDPLDYEYSQLINLSDKYISIMQPYVKFKLDTNNFDFWIEKRKEGEPRNPGMMSFF